MSFINKRSMYGNEYNACSLCEYQSEVKLIKRLIDIAEKAVEGQRVEEVWGHKGTCHSFAKTIVEYSKMAYDNLLMGHFYAVNMISRSVLENLVFLHIIDQNDELWRYYLVYSYYNTIYKLDRIPTQSELDTLQELYKDYNISEEFYVKQPRRKKAYIREPYGWTYQINTNKQFTFENVCDLMDSRAEYHGFQILSEYSHGTSLYMKMCSSVFVEGMMNMLINIYISLYQMLMMYCEDTVDEEFYDVTEEIEYIFHRYLQYEEE